MTMTILTYSSRSGSTFLARLLEERFRLCIVPEFQCAYTLFSMADCVELSLHEIGRLIEGDPQLNWISLEQVNSLGERKLKPVEAIGWIVEKYRDSVEEDATDYLLKLGGLAHLWPRVTQHLPDVRGLNIIRDGRAVTNSLLNSVSPYLSEKFDMGYGDPVWCAHTWAHDVNAQLRCVESFAASYQSVRYEDLIVDPDHTTREVGTFFGWDASSSSPKRFAVAASERSLHQNIDKPALATRISGWRDELPVSHRIVVESVARRELLALGYADHLSVGPAQHAGALVRAHALHVRQQTRGWVQRIRRIRTVSEVRAKVRRRLVTRSTWRV